MKLSPDGCNWYPRCLDWDEPVDPDRKWRCAGCGRQACIPLYGECPALALPLDDMGMCGTDG